jgi:hypothetical protein
MPLTVACDMPLMYAHAVLHSAPVCCMSNHSACDIAAGRACVHTTCTCVLATCFQTTPVPRVSPAEPVQLYTCWHCCMAFHLFNPSCSTPLADSAAIQPVAGMCCACGSAARLALPTMHIILVVPKVLAACLSQVLCLWECC